MDNFSFWKVNGDEAKYVTIGDSRIHLHQRLISGNIPYRQFLTLIKEFDLEVRFTEFGRRDVYANSDLIWTFRACALSDVGQPADASAGGGGLYVPVEIIASEVIGHGS